MAASVGFSKFTKRSASWAMAELLYWPLGSAERHRYGIVSAIRSLILIDLSESLISKNNKMFRNGHITDLRAPFNGHRATPDLRPPTDIWHYPLG